VNFAIRCITCTFVVGESDVLSGLAVGKSRKFLSSDLKATLEHGKTYYITVSAVNSAGVIGQGSCNITVELLPPDVENLVIQNMFTQADEETFDISLTHSEIGLEWGNGTDDVEFYGMFESKLFFGLSVGICFLFIVLKTSSFVSFLEWQIGSEKDSDDIFPRVKVGLSHSRKASIKNGELWIDDKSINATVGAFASSNNTNRSDESDQSFFNMEPGLCLHVKLFAVGRSHLSSSVNSKPTCTSRKCYNSNLV
jgi:hypothetical protein